MTVVALETSDGIDLAAEIALPAGEPGTTPLASAVLLHPHPMMGGNMAAPVVDHLFRQLPQEGFAVLRFDFRGVGESGGIHDGGNAESLDVRAAIDRLHTETNEPVWLVGWSFGADVSLQVTDESVAGWIGITPPLGSVPTDQMAAAGDPRPKHFLLAEHDQFRSPAEIQDQTADWVNTSYQVIPGTDHFLAGRLGAITLSTAAILETATA